MRDVRSHLGDDLVYSLPADTIFKREIYCALTCGMAAIDVEIALGWGTRWALDRVVNRL